MSDKTTVLEVIKKTVDYKTHKITIETYDTRYQGLVKQIKELSGINLADDLDGEFVADSLLSNIKYRQDQIDNSLDSFESYISGLGYTIPSNSFITLPAGTILPGEPLDYDLLESIVNNEKDFYNRRQIIKQIELYYNIKFQVPNTRIMNYLLNELIPLEQVFDVTKLNKYGTMRNHQYILSNYDTDELFSNKDSWDYIDYNANNVDKSNYKNELGNLQKKEVFKVE